MIQTLSKQLTASGYTLQFASLRGKPQDLHKIYVYSNGSEVIKLETKKEGIKWETDTTITTQNTPDTTRMMFLFYFPKIKGNAKIVNWSGYIHL